jgi:hypothetical protein
MASELVDAGMLYRATAPSRRQVRRDGTPRGARLAWVLAAALVAALYLRSRHVRAARSPR